MARYYSSVPMALWMTLLNLSGESPLCDYTPVGSLIVGALSVSAVAVFAVPVGAIGAGFEGVVSELSAGRGGGGGGGGEETPLFSSAQAGAPVLFGAGSSPSAAKGEGGRGVYGAVLSGDNAKVVLCVQPRCCYRSYFFRFRSCCFRFFVLCLLLLPRERMQ